MNVFKEDLFGITTSIQVFSPFPDLTEMQTFSSPLPPTPVSFFPPSALFPAAFSELFGPFSFPAFWIQSLPLVAQGSGVTQRGNWVSLLSFDKIHRESQSVYSHLCLAVVILIRVLTLVFSKNVPCVFVGGDNIGRLAFVIPEKRYYNVSKQVKTTDYNIFYWGSHSVVKSLKYKSREAWNRVCFKTCTFFHWSKRQIWMSRKIKGFLLWFLWSYFLTTSRLEFLSI